jgi:alkane 1-monooxygenase
MRTLGFWHALPFFMTFLAAPLLALGAALGGWAVFLLPPFAWALFDLLDLVVGLDASNADPDTPEAHLNWHRAVTILWVPVQS